MSLLSLLLLAGPGLGARNSRSLVNTFPFNAEAEGGHQEHHGGRQEARRLDTAAALASRGAKQVDKEVRRGNIVTLDTTLVQCSIIGFCRNCIYFEKKNNSVEDGKRERA